MSQPMLLRLNVAKLKLFLSKQFVNQKFNIILSSTDESKQINLSAITNEQLEGNQGVILI